MVNAQFQTGLVVYQNSDNHEIVEYAIKHELIDEDDILWIKNQLRGDRDEPTAFWVFSGIVDSVMHCDDESDERDHTQPSDDQWDQLSDDSDQHSDEQSDQQSDSTIQEEEANNEEDNNEEDND